MTSSAPDGTPMHRVAIDPAIAKLSLAERQKLEHDAIERIVARTDEAHRASLRESLMSGATITHASDPEVARLLGIIASARSPLTEQAGRSTTDISASPKATPTLVRVALLKKVGPGEKEKVVVRRSPDDGGIPLVMVAESATSGEVEVGLRAAIQSVKRNPAGVAGPSLLRISKASPAMEEKRRAKRILKDLRAVAAERHEGIGQAKVLLIGVR